MLFGYVEKNSYTIKNDEDDPILSADYYFGTNEDGARHTGWLQYTDALTDKDDDYYWFYFNTSNGVKVVDQKKTINGKKYSFNDEGIMSKEWTVDVATEGTLTTYNAKWYSKLEDGSLAKNKWIWNKPYEAKDGLSYELDSTRDDYNDETPRWFRTDAAGNLIKRQTKKINSKWYVFDDDGVMRTGLVVLDKADGAVSNAKYLAAYDMDTVTKDELITDTMTDDDSLVGKRLHYFSEDEEKDGSMKTGTMKIELSDDEYTFCFTKTTGAAKCGYDSSSKKVYNAGILEKAGDDKYKVVQDLYNYVMVDGEKVYNSYLVGSTGSVVKNVSKYKDANDAYFIYQKGSDSDSWVIYKTTDEDVAKNALSSNADTKADALASCAIVGGSWANDAKN